MRAILGYCLLFILLALMSCRTEEDTPPLSPVPAITFKGLTKYTLLAPRPRNSFVGDSVNLIIDYQDGDGDLGYTWEEANKLWDRYGVEGVRDKRTFNYYLDVEKKANGVFKPILFPNPLFTFWSIFPRVEEETQSLVSPFKIRRYSSQRGELTYSIPIEPPIDPSPVYIQIGDTLRCRIQIADRAMNVSNTIETPEFVFMR